MASDLAVLLILSCVISISNTVKVGPGRCPRGPIVTSTACGRLGNIVWDYADIISVAKIVPGSYQPYMRKYQEPHIKRLFEGPYLPVLEDMPANCSCCASTDWNKPNMGDVSVRQVRAWNKTGNIIIHSPSVLEQPMFLLYKYIKQTLRYRSEYIDAANKVFTNVSLQYLRRQNRTRQLTFVGVHVRRSDYLRYLRPEQKANATFFNFAFDYFRNRNDLGECVFLLLSDDPKWAKDNLISNRTNSDVFLVSDISKADATADLVLLSLCNHSIFDYGSFGLWGAVYTGGEVVTTTSYGKAYPFIRWKNFHFFDPVPTTELTTLSYYVKFPNYSVH